MNSKKKTLLDTDSEPGDSGRQVVLSFSGLEGGQVCLSLVVTGPIDPPKHIQHAQ